MNNNFNLFYKERELSNKKENISFRIDSNIKKELVKHFEDKYGSNGLTIGMNEMVSDYLNNTPLIRTNLPIYISLAVPKNDEQIYNLTIDDFSDIDFDDERKDKLKILRIGKYKGIKDNVFKEQVSFQDMNDTNIWNVIGIDENLDEFNQRFNLLPTEYENIIEVFNESISLDYDKFYDIDNVYIFHFLLNNFLDDKFDGTYGNNGIHYGAFSFKVSMETTYYIIIEFNLNNIFNISYYCYLVTKEIFENTLQARNIELYENYKTIDIIADDEKELRLLSLATEIQGLKNELKQKEHLYNLIKESDKF